MTEHIPSVKITDRESGVVYELDYNRDAIRLAERNGFKLDDVMEYPNTKIPELFFYAFRAHHKALARDKTDALLEKMGGVSGKLLQRLINLYNQAGIAHVIVDEDELEKNELVTVEL